jgi:glucan phosphoethanolaminetransferase (alkaline phosphatase superfamily)
VEFFCVAFIYLWIASAFTALAGTLYWLRIPRHAPNKDAELIGLQFLYWWLGMLSAVYCTFLWLAKRMWEDGLSP